MPNKRVHELAKELGYNKQELINEINQLDLGFRVANAMVKLSEDDVERVKKALKKGEKKASSAKKTKKKAEPKKVEASDTPAPAPVVRRRKKAAVKEEPVEGEAQAASASSGVRVIRRKRKVVEQEPAAAAAEPVVEAAAPEVVEQAPAAAEAAPEPAAPEAPTPEAQPAKVAAQAEPETPAPEAPAPAAVAEQPATPESAAPSAPAAAADGAAAAVDPRGAKVLGRIDLSTMQDRMDTRRFTPAPDAGSDSSSGRRSGKRRSVEFNDDRSSGGGGYGSDNRRGGRNSRSVRDHSSIYENRRGGKRGKRGKKKEQRTKKTEITVAAEHKRVVRIEDTVTVGELGREMGVKAGMIALKLMELGMTANVNTTVDYDTASLIAEQFGYTVENVAFDIAQFYDTTEDAEDIQAPRPPIVTVMGHVDHGKTSLLDAIRSASVTSGEAGGITQHIGAYTVEAGNGTITFLDTPGHEAFTALRARGAQATDIVILVVAADDGVMPQTVEAINHSRDAGVPIIVAVNKIDKVSANPDRVKQALVEYELVPEEWGGETLFVDVSALKNQNIDVLMENVLLQAEVQDLKAAKERDAQGLVIESRLDKGRGPLASVLVRRGTLRTGDIVVIGEHYGRVRSMLDHKNEPFDVAGPSIPAEITGLNGVPEAGEPFFVVEEERDAKRITEHVAEQNRQKHLASLALSNMDILKDTLFREGGPTKKLKVIVKADVQGSIEALRHAFTKIGNDEVSIDVIHSAVGGVTENDVNLAASSSDDAVIIVGFNVRPDNRASEVAEKYNIEIMTFSIIYDAIDTLRDLLEGLLAPVEKEVIIGQAEVRDTFSAPKVGTVAGLYVTDGMLRRDARARLLRQGRIVYESTISSLRRFKDDVREVKKGFECGASMANYNDIKVGDVIEAFEIEEVAATF